MLSMIQPYQCKKKKVGVRHHSYTVLVSMISYHTCIGRDESYLTLVSWKYEFILNKTGKYVLRPVTVLSLNSYLD